MLKIFRASIMHTPQSPFAGGLLASYEDGALVIKNDEIIDLDDYAKIATKYPNAKTHSFKNSFILPGLIDTHVHYPQIPVIGAMGLRLLDWLEQRTLPAEAKLADRKIAKKQAKIFLKQLARNGTTTALVFGAHFATAMEEFFIQADKSKLRITAGLVLGDRLLHPDLYTSPQKAYSESKALIEKWHNKNRLRYAVTPRFSVSCSDEILAVCGKLLAEYPDLYFTTHINEQIEEIKLVKEQFGAPDYLETYEKHNLINERSILAHNVHPSDSELSRIARANAAVAHCPSSNMFIGSGLFNMLKHLEHRVKFGLGSDVGGGTGFSIFKEGLNSYQVQMLQKNQLDLGSSHLLYLASLAGAEALGLDTTVGSFEIGKKADFIVLKPQAKSTLAINLKYSSSAEDSLASIFTLARADAIKDVFVSGESVL